jgi:hypothetical protein
VTAGGLREAPKLRATLCPVELVESTPDALEAALSVHRQAKSRRSGR